MELNERIACMNVDTVPQKEIYISLPESDYRFISTLSKKMGWTIHRKRKTGLDLALEDVAAGRIYHAKDGADLINQCLQ